MLWPSFCTWFHFPPDVFFWTFHIFFSFCSHHSVFCTMDLTHSSFLRVSFQYLSLYLNILLFVFMLFDPSTCESNIFAVVFQFKRVEHRRKRRNEGPVEAPRVSCRVISDSVPHICFSPSCSLRQTVLRPLLARNYWAVWTGTSKRCKIGYFWVYSCTDVKSVKWLSLSLMLSDCFSLWN